MNVTGETVREVCAEMQLHTYQTMFRTSDVIGWRDRILDAYERKISEKDAEIARLKAAFKECLNGYCRTNDYGDECELLIKYGIEKCREKKCNAVAWYDVLAKSVCESEANHAND